MSFHVFISFSFFPCKNRITRRHLEFNGFQIKSKNYFGQCSCGSASLLAKIRVFEVRGVKIHSNGFVMRSGFQEVFFPTHSPHFRSLLFPCGLTACIRCYFLNESVEWNASEPVQQHSLRREHSCENCSCVAFVRNEVRLFKRNPQRQRAWIVC